jgi:hypothetical protein
MLKRTKRRFDPNKGGIKGAEALASRTLSNVVTQEFIAPLFPSSLPAKLSSNY